MPGDSPMSLVVHQRRSWFSLAPSAREWLDLTIRGLTGSIQRNLGAFKMSSGSRR